MAAELIGRCRCPLCRSEKARLTLAKSGLPVLTCNGCNFQGFARSDRSDDAMRALLVAEPAAAPTPPDQAKPITPEQANQLGQVQANAAPTVQPKPEPAPAPKPAFRWGAFPGI